MQFVLHFLSMQTRYLGRVGGRTTGETTRRILCSLFSNRLARVLNFAGRGMKVGVKDTALLAVIQSLSNVSVFQ